MIVVRIYGGLGNQMFQYAAALSLALRHGVPLKLDLRWMATYRNQPLLLTNLPVQKAEPTVAERLAYTAFPFRRHPPYPFFRRLATFWPRVYMEPHPGFDEAFLLLGRDHFLFGYFQSYRYFADCTGALRRDFNHPLDESLYEDQVVRRARSAGAVAVQFRRGDYVTDPETSRSIGVCSADYYRNALALVRANVADPVFLVFSDDIRWCRANVDIEDALFVERKAGTPLDDMSLARQCRNIILANSTFSWWCAWLRTPGEGVTVAPSRWFRDDQLNEQTADLCPPSWTRI